MYLADYHVHSRVSPDASASMTELAEAAIRLGFQELCFTDHVEPIRFGTTEPRESYDWAPMLAEFRAAQAAVGDRITLRLGAELGDAAWGARSSPWAPTPTRRRPWAAPSGRDRLCCGRADSGDSAPSGAENRSGMICNLHFGKKLAIISLFQNAPRQGAN